MWSIMLVPKLSFVNYKPCGVHVINNNTSSLFPHGDAYWTRKIIYPHFKIVFASSWDVYRKVLCFKNCIRIWQYNALHGVFWMLVSIHGTSSEL